MESLLQLGFCRGEVHLLTGDVPSRVLGVEILKQPCSSQCVESPSKQRSVENLRMFDP